MATVSIRFRPSTVSGKEGTLYYRVTHRRVSRQINTGCKIFPDEWENGRLASGNEKRNVYLRNLEAQLEKELERLNSLIRRLELNGKDYTAGQVVEAYRTSGTGHTSHTDHLCGFVQVLANRLRQTGKVRLAETYTTATNRFLRFLGKDRDPAFDEFDAPLMKSYEAHLRQQGLVPNTPSFSLRNLRAIYHRAVEAGLTEDRRPFRRVFTGVEKTAKRAIPPAVIRRIRTLPLPPDGPLAQARDLFLFSFYTRGMPFVDLAGLRKQDLRDGMLSYRRCKTGRALSVRWEKPMQEIVNRHSHRDSPYLLPVLDTPGADDRRRYLNALHSLNRHLKAIGRLADSPIPLTSYCARQAWASIAQSERVPIGIICEAMGHTSERTTRIYLSSLDTSAVDEANRKVLRTVCGKTRT